VCAQNHGGSWPPQGGCRKIPACQCFIIFVPMVSYFALLCSVLLDLFMCKINLINKCEAMHVRPFLAIHTVHADCRARHFGPGIWPYRLLESKARLCILCVESLFISMNKQCQPLYTLK